MYSKNVKKYRKNLKLSFVNFFISFYYYKSFYGYNFSQKYLGLLITFIYASGFIHSIEYIIFQNLIKNICMLTF